jgi:hypothetical protein
MMINKRLARQFMLDYAQRSGRKLTRISSEGSDTLPSVWDRIEAGMRKVLRGIVDEQSRSGRTIR